jgi:hypothetical protein
MLLDRAQLTDHGVILEYQLGNPSRRLDATLARRSPTTHAERLAVSNDARLLLQLSMKTCDWTGMRFGRDLYFYVRESALREGDLSGAWYDMD